MGSRLSYVGHHRPPCAWIFVLCGIAIAARSVGADDADDTDSGTKRVEYPPLASIQLRTPSSGVLRTPAEPGLSKILWRSHPSSPLRASRREALLRREG